MTSSKSADMYPNIAPLGPKLRLCAFDFRNRWQRGTPPYEPTLVSRIMHQKLIPTVPQEAGVRIVLGELLLVGTHGFQGLVEEDAPGTGGPLVDGDYVRHLAFFRGGVSGWWTLGRLCGLGREDF